MNQSLVINDPQPLQETSSLEPLQDDSSNFRGHQKEEKLQYMPKEKRMGLFSSVTLIPEAVDPRKYLERVKLIIVLVVAFAALSGPMGTSIILPAIENLTEQLQTTTSIANISVGIYLISLGIFPLWWSSLCERIGRRTVNLVSFTWFFAFSIGCALAPNVEALIVLRFLAVVGASSVQACGAGTIADLYIQEERGTALGLFYLGPLLGPFLSPIVGGAVAMKWGWRATMWIMVIVCGLNFTSILFFLPETLSRNIDLASQKELEEESPEVSLQVRNLYLEKRICRVLLAASYRRMNQLDETPVDPIMPSVTRFTTNQSTYSKSILQKEFSRVKSENHEKESFSIVLYDVFVRPLHSLILFRYPPVALAIVFSGVSFAGIYLLNITVSSRYSKLPYNFPSMIIGLLYIPNSIAYIIASIYGGRWNDHLIKKSAKCSGGVLTPELRISWNAVLAVALYPPLCLIFGWCLDKKTFWIYPLIGSALFGFASMLTIGLIVTYLVDVLPGRGPTGIALNNLCRQLLAAIATFVTELIINALGAGLLFSIYSGVFLAAALFLWFLKRNGASYRQKYDLMNFYAHL